MHFAAYIGVNVKFLTISIKLLVPEIIMSFKICLSIPFIEITPLSTKFNIGHTLTKYKTPDIKYVIATNFCLFAIVITSAKIYSEPNIIYRDSPHIVINCK